SPSRSASATCRISTGPFAAVLAARPRGCASPRTPSPLDDREGLFGAVLRRGLELAPSHHSITSSAVASNEGGTVSPRALAVLLLITSSNRVGDCTGRSAGFSPRRMRST